MTAVTRTQSHWHCSTPLKAQLNLIPDTGRATIRMQGHPEVTHDEPSEGVHFPRPGQRYRSSPFVVTVTASECDLLFIFIPARAWPGRGRHRVRRDGEGARGARMVQDPAARLARRSDKVLRDPASCTSATAAPSRSDKVVYIVTTAFCNLPIARRGQCAGRPTRQTSAASLAWFNGGG